MRSIWSGALSFGLVNIPVRLYSATRENELHFEMLHKTDLSPIRYARICKKDGKEIPYKDIVKGYEYQKGDYVVLVEEDFKKANVRLSKTIDIVDFVNEDEIDTVFYEKPYFLEPDKGAANPYGLLCEALRKSKKVGIARFVLRNREHIGVIKPYHNAIILNQLRYNAELSKTSELKIPEVTKFPSREVEMAIKLIEQLTINFKPETYHDSYTEELLQIIDEKAKGKPRKKAKEPDISPTGVKDMMSMLKASLEQHKKRHRKAA